MKKKKLLSNRECVWIRQQFGGAFPEGLHLEEGFPLPVHKGSTRREAYVPEALVSLLARGLAEIRPGSDAAGRYFFTLSGQAALLGAFDQPFGLDRDRYPHLFAALQQAPGYGRVAENDPPGKVAS